MVRWRRKGGEGDTYERLNIKYGVNVYPWGLGMNEFMWDYKLCCALRVMILTLITREEG